MQKIMSRFGEMGQEPKKRLRFMRFIVNIMSWESFNLIN